MSEFGQSSLSETIQPIIQLPYNITEKNVYYTNDFEYRAWLRRLLCMVPPNDGTSTNDIENDDDDLDEITRDELNYDEKAAEHSLNYVYDRTHNHPLFQELYSLAAGVMFSLDKNIGLSVLFSYDYMALFHQCLCCYFENPDEFDDKHAAYTCIRKKLT